jgi:hypothetical protein
MSAAELRDLLTYYCASEDRRGRDTTCALADAGLIEDRGNPAITVWVVTEPTFKELVIAWLFGEELRP